MSAANDRPLVLGIESSCDETAAAVVRGSTRVLSNVVATQHELHRRYAGVVPEIASRAHLERIVPVVRDALDQADVTFKDLNAIAIGNRPGLIGSLIVGIGAAKTLAWSLELPLIGVDHIVAHLHAGLLNAEPIEYPAVGLVVSGGHTSLFQLDDPLSLQLLGRTIDDAVGEAYDKAATILELGYPGGPEIDRMAQQGNEHAHDFPVALMQRDNLNFSFSGLKTSLLYAVRGAPRRGDKTFPHHASELTEAEKADFAASFQSAAIRALIRKLELAIDRCAPRTLLAGGGVTANTRLRAELKAVAARRHLDLRLPAAEFCLDNAAMIAGYGAVKHQAGLFDDFTLAAQPRSQMLVGAVSP